ncbi:septum formation family protein [Georgenia sp. Z1344]|uniref:septum formation family protein n=1 Tax=Georgenia sp. Z1344 TaxID=3416706 RepID=UPI003CFAEDA4
MNQWSAQSPGSGAPGGWGTGQVPQGGGYAQGGWSGGDPTQGVPYGTTPNEPYGAAPAPYSAVPAGAYQSPQGSGGGPWGGGGPDDGNRAVYVVLAIAAVLVVVLVVVGLFVHRSFTSTAGTPTETTSPGPAPGPGGGTTTEPPQTTEPPAPTAPPGVEESGATTVFDIDVGNCALYSDYTALSNDLVLTPCAEPHFMEFYHVFDVPDREEFPGVDGIHAEAQEGCRVAWDALPEPSLDLARVELSTLAPSQRTWDNGDREVLCVARTVDETDSLQGNFQDGSAVLTS